MEEGAGAMSGLEAEAPSLRFGTISAPWERKRFGEFATLRRGLTYTPADCREKGVRVLRSSNISEETFVLHSDDVFVSEQAANIPFVKNGDILITAANGSSHLVGKHALIDGVGEKDTVHGGFMLLAESDLPEFLDAAMSALWYKQFVADYMMGGNGALGNLAKSSFDECTFLAPPTQSEQRRIGSFFRSLDAMIAGREKALGKLEALKKSMLLKMFPQGDAKAPEVRFKGFEGEWETNPLDKWLVVSDEENRDGRFTAEDVLSVSGDYGVVNQIEFQGRSFAGASLSHYRVLKKDQVVYTKSPLKRAPFGIVKANLFQDGIVSALYGVYDTAGADSAFVQYYFGSLVRLNNYLRPLVNKGAKNTLLISDEDAVSGVVCFPSLPEQRKIGAYFRSLDALIAARREEVEKLKQMKKALLERMFV